MGPVHTLEGEGKLLPNLHKEGSLSIGAVKCRHSPICGGNILKIFFQQKDSGVPEDKMKLTGIDLELLHPIDCGF